MLVLVEVDDRVATVTLNRPEARNAISAELHAQLDEAVTGLDARDDVGCMVLTGADPAFCAGMDLKSLATELREVQRDRQRGPAQRSGMMPPHDTPVIGAINGPTVTGGLELAMCCDFLIASERARFADTHVKVGVVAGDGGAVIWPLLMGPHRAKEFLMRGNFINGAEAGRIGMVNYAVPSEEVLTRSRALAQELADGPTWAIRWSKLSVNKWLKQQANLILDASLAYEMMTFKTEDHKEAVSAFVEKRKPNFVRSSEE